MRNSTSDLYNKKNINGFTLGNISSMKIVNSAYMSQGQAVPSKIYRPPKNNYVLMYLFSINTHTFTYPALPKAISCKKYYSWPMMFSLSLFSKKTWRQWRTCISWARDCVNINWGLELLEHTTYGAYNSVVTVHVQNDAPATRCEPSLYYKKKNKKKQGKIMTLPGAPTKT
ncbi:hypothetical protein PVAP13_4KG295810 [Panicum virgatum]|uniref:Uncharacterized protein n=1 Tax=Panicum virgatum TaxID=38727 RepID=A0A8T0TX66_PANVG|nr:hypothetical protein PVAP13_4KG295810 [Panicum virgatum]